MFINEIIRKFFSIYIGIILGLLLSQECIYPAIMVNI